MAWLINAAQVDKLRKDQKNVIILDASWHLPTDGRDSRAEFEAGHITGARYLDFSAFHDQQSDLPNMLLRNEDVIREKLGALGITNEHKIIFYDNSKFHTSCRAVWMMQVFGHQSHLLHILDGGYSAWEKYGGKIDTGPQRGVPARIYNLDFQSHAIRTLVQMKTNLHHPQEQVIDMRHPVRFCGGAEHRVGLRSGHIPGSFSFPYMTFFETDGRFKPIDKIRKQLLALGVDLDKPIVTTCGSGMTAAILNVALDLMNEQKHALYDGSWAEWGFDSTYPGEESVAERPVEDCLGS